MADTPSPEALEVARALGREMQEACGIYHAGTIGRIALAIDRFAAVRVEAERERLQKIIDGEQEARQKCEAALRGKDAAMGVLWDRLTIAGVDCSDLIP